MFGNTVSSRSSSSRSGNSYGRNSSMPSLRQNHHHHPLSPRTSINPLFRHSDSQFTSSFDASNFVLSDNCRYSRRHDKKQQRYNSRDQSNYNSYDNNLIIKISDNSIGHFSSCSDGGDSGVVREYNARDFLERYSLPRVIKIDGCEPLLLYRCFDSFTKIQAKCVFSRKGKEKISEDSLHFPEGYAGWFSLLNEKGEKHAVAYTSILHLVREQVCSFLAAQPFTAYATQSSDPEECDGKLAYFKTQVPGGQLFQLRAVFQHQDKPDGFGNIHNSTRSSRISRSSRDRELSNRYAQLISQNNQELYVPLTTKGEFYETHTSLKSRVCFPGMLDKTGPLALDKDCLYKISHLLRRVPLPVKVKLLHGTSPDGVPELTDTFILEKKFREPILVTCTLPPPWSSELKHELGYFNINTPSKLSKFDFGYDSEGKMFKSQRLQSALGFCQKNLESWYKEMKLVPRFEKNHNAVIKVIKTEDLEGVSQENSEKPKKWYRNLRILPSLNINQGRDDKFEEMKDPMDGMEKRKSIDRYKDMSKLIEEKLGRKGYNPVKKSASFMFTKKLENIETNPENSSPAALLKCQSLDSQLYPLTEEKCNNNDEFQMCILENTGSNSNGGVVQKIEQIEKSIEIDDDFIEPLDVKVSKPDLIPTLPKKIITTQRLYTEFHVKTKIQNKKINKTTKHQNSSKVLLNVDEIPYCNVKDEVCSSPSGKNENIYAEICENEPKMMCNHCDTKNCRTKSEITTTKQQQQYCYVKLGSNGDSVTQSDSDEAIYNTLS